MLRVLRISKYYLSSIKYGYIKQEINNFSEAIDMQDRQKIFKLINQHSKRINKGESLQQDNKDRQKNGDAKIASDLFLLKNLQIHVALGKQNVDKLNAIQKQNSLQSLNKRNKIFDAEQDQDQGKQEDENEEEEVQSKKKQGKKKEKEDKKKEDENTEKPTKRVRQKSTKNKQFENLVKAQQEQQSSNIKQQNNTARKGQSYMSKNPLITSKMNVADFKGRKSSKKSILEDRVIIFRQNLKADKEYNLQFQQDWVYAYDLPLYMSPETIQTFLAYISKKYGQIITYQVDNCYDAIKLGRNQQLQIEFAEDQQNTQKIIQKQRKKREKNKKGQQQPQNLHEAQKSLQQNLKKALKYNDVYLNKTSMVFQFLRKQDKSKFISTEMRLYGLRFNFKNNAKFQQASSKKCIKLSMLPPIFHVQEFAEFITEKLKHLGLNFDFNTATKNITKQHHVFLQFFTFYDALLAKRLLNGEVFLKHRIRAQFLYGPSKVHGGMHFPDYQDNHFQQLVKKFKMMNYRGSQ